MTLEAFAPLLADDCDIVAEALAPRHAPCAFPANDPANPEAGWATRNPNRALLFLFVSPRDCAAVDELIAL